MPVAQYDWDEIEDNIDEVFDENFNSIAEYTTEPEFYGNVISQFRAGATSTFHHDGLGSTIAVTNDSGDVTDTLAYSAFGSVTHRTGISEFPFQFVGQRGYYFDTVLGQYHIRRRDLDPTHGRWQSIDPLGFVDSTNLYMYARNRAILFIDPSGRSIVKCYCEVAHVGQRGTHWEYSMTIVRDFLDSEDDDCTTACCGRNRGRPDPFNTCSGTAIEFTRHEKLLLELCSFRHLACDKCDEKTCKDVIRRVLDSYYYADRETSILEATPLMLLNPYGVGGYCHAWKNNFFNAVNFSIAKDKPSCLNLDTWELDLEWASTWYNDHGFNVLQNKCTKECYIIQNWPETRIVDPCLDKTWTVAKLEPDGLWNWNELLRRCRCEKRLVPRRR